MTSAGSRGLRKAYTLPTPRPPKRQFPSRGGSRRRAPAPPQCAWPALTARNAVRPGSPRGTVTRSYRTHLALEPADERGYGLRYDKNRVLRLHAVLRAARRGRGSARAGAERSASVPHNEGQDAGMPQRLQPPQRILPKLRPERQLEDRHGRPVRLRRGGAGQRRRQRRYEGGRTRFAPFSCHCANATRFDPRTRALRRRC